MYHDYFADRLEHALRRATDAPTERERNAHAEMAVLYSELLQLGRPGIERFGLGAALTGQDLGNEFRKAG